MREIFYTQEDILASFHRWNPQLHQYARDCRAAKPIPTLESLTVADEAKLDILIESVAAVRARPRYYQSPHTRIIHGSELTLLACKLLFAADDRRWLSLLSEDWLHWRREVFSGAPDWFSTNWITIHDPMPQEMLEEVLSVLDIPRKSKKWLLTTGRDGNASHELCVWEEPFLFRLGVVMEECVEDVTIDSLTLPPN